jgi:hypothetical protein
MTYSASSDKVILDGSRMTLMSEAYKRHRHYLKGGKERIYQQSFRSAAASPLSKESNQTPGKESNASGNAVGDFF